MKFSLINVTNTRENGNVDGWWEQNHIGTLESATQAAIDTERANGKRIDIAVVDQVSEDTHGDPFRIDLVRLDQRRIEVAS